MWSLVFGAFRLHLTFRGTKHIMHNNNNNNWEPIAARSPPKGQRKTVEISLPNYAINMFTEALCSCISKAGDEENNRHQQQQKHENGNFGKYATNWRFVSCPCWPSKQYKIYTYLFTTFSYFDFCSLLGGDNGAPTVL